MKRAWTIAFAVLALVGTPPALVADVVRLKDGRTLEGKIVEEDGTTIHLRLRHALVPIAKSDVAAVERKPTPEDEYGDRAAKATDVASHLALAEWCAAKGLDRERRRELTAVLALEPSHPEVNRLLGNVEYQGRWMSAAEAARARDADVERENEAKGLARFKGEWVPKEDLPFLEQGLRKVDGKWLTEAEVWEQRGYIEFQGRWIPKEEAEKRLAISEERARELHYWEKPWVLESEHYILTTNTFREIGEKTLGIMEHMYGHYRDRFGAEPRWKSKERRLRINLFRTFEEYRRIAKGPEGTGGFYSEAPTNQSFFFWNRSPYINEFSVSLHEGAHQFYQNAFWGYSSPTWYTEGMACYFEGVAWDGTYVKIGRIPPGRLAGAQAAMRSPDFMPLRDLLRYRYRIEDGKLLGDDGKVDRLYSEGWALCFFLLHGENAAYRDKFREFEKAIQTERIPPIHQETRAAEIFEGLFGADLAKLEADWKAFTLALDPKSKPQEWWDEAKSKQVTQYRKLLYGEHPYQRYEGLVHLSKFADQPEGKAEVRRMIDLVDDADVEVRIAAVAAIGPLKEKGALPALLRAVRDPESILRRRAISALVALEAPESVPELLAIASDRQIAEPGLRESAIDGAAQVVRKIPADRLKVDGGIVERTASSLASILADGEASSGVRRSAAAALGSLRAESARPALRAAAASRDPEIQEAAVVALAETGDESAIPLVKAILEDPKRSAERRARALRAVAFVPTVESLVLALERAADASPALREAASIAIAQSAPARAVPALVEIASENDAGEAVRARAIDVLAHFKDKSIAPTLAALLRAKEPSISERAAIALGETGDKRATPVLARLLADASKPEPVRLEACRALASVKTDAALAALEKALQPPASSLAEEAAFALGDAGSDRGAAILLGVATRKDADPQRRARAIRLLASLKYRRATKTCVDLLEDANGVVADAADAALQSFSGKAFGFKSDLAPEKRRAALAEWKKWWDKNRDKTKYQ